MSNTLYIQKMNILGLVLSFALIGIVVGLGVLMSRFEKISPEVVRKFIHIAVSNWWFILLFAFNTLQIAIIGPIFFIIANGTAVFTGLANVLGEKDIKRNLGLVYFPISLLVLVVLAFTGIIPLWASTIGVFTMGYGDGLAALIGTFFGKKKVFGQKSYVGSIVMFITTTIVILITSFAFKVGDVVSIDFLLRVFVISISATLIEIFTPSGLDNLSVPIGTAILSALVIGTL